MYTQIDFIAYDTIASYLSVVGKLNRIMQPHLVNKSRSEVLGRRCTAFYIML